MGADIHGWIEVKKDGKWIAVRELEGSDRERNYRRFAALANVRNYFNDTEAINPKGVPEDISDTAKYWVDYWGEGGHSHSFINAQDAALIYLDTEVSPSVDEKQYPEISYLYWNGKEKVHPDNCRLVFWFDN